MWRSHQLLPLSSIGVLISLGEGLTSELRRAHCILVEVCSSTAMGYSINIAYRVLVSFSGAPGRPISHKALTLGVEIATVHFPRIEARRSASSAWLLEVIQETSIILIIYSRRSLQSSWWQVRLALPGRRAYGPLELALPLCRWRWRLLWWFQIHHWI